MPTLPADALAQLAASQPQPDVVEHLTRSAFLHRLYDAGQPVAEFQGIGYALAVHLSADLDAYVVAPPRAMAKTDTYWFYDDRLSDGYARACLWALNQVVRDVAAEEQA